MCRKRSASAMPALIKNCFAGAAASFWQWSPRGAAIEATNSRTGNEQGKSFWAPYARGHRVVEIVHGEHDAEIAESVHRGVPVIGDRRRREKARQFDPAVAVRGTHHGDLDALVAQSSDAP